MATSAAKPEAVEETATTASTARRSERRRRRHDESARSTTLSSTSSSRRSDEPGSTASVTIDPARERLGRSRRSAAREALGSPSRPSGTQRVWAGGDVEPSVGRSGQCAVGGEGADVVGPLGAGEVAPGDAAGGGLPMVRGRGPRAGTFAGADVVVGILTADCEPLAVEGDVDVVPLAVGHADRCADADAGGDVVEVDALIAAAGGDERSVGGAAPWKTCPRLPPKARIGSSVSRSYCTSSPPRELTKSWSVTVMNTPRRSAPGIDPNSSPVTASYTWTLWSCRRRCGDRCG